ncbi:UNVERIFIED_CONTAM: hypothetical protein FKN15_052805 [Acipenser sinensis]
MDRNALAELLQALESRRDAEERRREERYTALIERSPKSRLAVPAQEQGQQRAKGGSHSGMASSHPNSHSVLMARAQAGSSGQKKFGSGLQTCHPFMAGSSPPWGSGHPFSCSEIAAGGAGLLPSPPSSWLAAALHGAPATVFPAAKVRLGKLDF